MKVKYIGPVYEVYVPRIGRFIRGQEYEYPNEVVEILLRNTGFRLVDPPKRVRRPRRRVRARVLPKPKVGEKVVEKPEPIEEESKPAWVKPKKEEEPPVEETSLREEEVKIEIEETPKEV